jgi:hypothetical protein
MKTARLKADRCPKPRRATSKPRTGRCRLAPRSGARSIHCLVCQPGTTVGTGITGGTGVGGCRGGVGSSESESGSLMGEGVCSGGSLIGLCGAPNVDRARSSTRRPTRTRVSTPGTCPHVRNSVKTAPQKGHAGISFKMASLRGESQLPCSGQLSASSARCPSRRHSRRASRWSPSG